MAPDYPSDLIQDVKIRLRQAAGVPSFDPGYPALPSVPSVADAVAALDPTLPDYLRCKRCHGGLFRGINSTLCIFCGAEQRGEDISRSISFNSTAGFQKWLQSLDLDGSEMVNLESESNDSSKGQDSPKGGVTLAKFLDLELRWPSEEIDNNSSNEAPSQVALVSFSGVDLDSFFSDQKNEVSSRSNTSQSTSNAPQVSAHVANSFSVDLDNFPSGTRNETASSAQNGAVEQFMPREHGVNTHANLFSRSQNFGFLEGLDMLNSSADAKGGDLDDAFADWETNFQTASSATFEAKFKQIDTVQSSSNFQPDNPTDLANTSRTNDAFADWETNFRTASSATFEAKFKQIDTVQSSEDFQSGNPAAVTAESRTINIFHNPIDHQSGNYDTTESKQIDSFQNSSNFQPDNPTALANTSRTNDLFQNSGDFQSVNSEAVATESRHIDHFQNSSTDFSPIIISKSDQNAYIGINSSKDGTGKDLTHEVDQLASRNGWFQDDVWSQISSKPSMETDKLESISNTFVGELKTQEKETTSVSVGWTQDDLWQSSANEINNTESLNHHDDDLFDDWQESTTATNVLGISPILQSLTRDKVHVLPSEANSGDVEDLEFGCFIQSDSSSAALNDLQSSSHVNTMQGGDSIAHSRANRSNVETENASVTYSGLDFIENIPDASDLDAYKVDMLLAQMPDLSFMLEESLSIPKNPSSSELNT